MSFAIMIFVTALYACTCRCNARLLHPPAASSANSANAAHAGSSNRSRVLSNKRSGDVILPILFLHFHKAAGTAAHAYFKKTAKLSIPKGANDEDAGEKLMNGSWKEIASSKWKGKRGTNVVMIENGQYWPEPEYFHTLSKSWPGVIATIIRDPWARFRSNFERTHANEKDMSIEDFGDKRGDRLISVQHYGEFNRPNFYVRMLNGLAGKHLNPIEDMTERHLERAKGVLEAFDRVMILEDPHKMLLQQLAELTGVEKNADGVYPNLPIQSNNKYSSAYDSPTGKNRKKKFMNRLGTRPEVEYYRSIFVEKNQMDIALYNWVVEREAKELGLGLGGGGGGEGGGGPLSRLDPASIKRNPSSSVLYVGLVGAVLLCIVVSRGRFRL